jgi:threonine dehydrogenase-like Zn-dependent dehydrogenase
MTRYSQIAVVGAVSYHPRHHELALALLQRGVISTDVVTHTFPLQDAAQAVAVADASEALHATLLFA